MLFDGVGESSGLVLEQQPVFLNMRQRNKNVQDSRIIYQKEFLKKYMNSRGDFKIYNDIFLVTSEKLKKYLQLEDSSLKLGIQKILNKPTKAKKHRKKILKVEKWQIHTPNLIRKIVS